MLKFLSAPFDLFPSAVSFMRKSFEAGPKIFEATLDHATTVQTFWTGVSKYVNAFMAPSSNALIAFMNTEKGQSAKASLMDNLIDYRELFSLNHKLAGIGFKSGMDAMTDHYYQKMGEAWTAWVDTFYGENGNDIARFTTREKELMDIVVNEYPKAIDSIKSEYGFHFDDGGYINVAETERFKLYQVLPQDKGIEVGEDRKPILIIPPYVLGENILAFLPEEQRSYVHSFANQGIPTYIRSIKDIDTNEAVQLMTGEDDALDIRFFSEILKAKHGQKVTLNGFCQGGYHSLAALLAGELDGLVDGFITCATPLDGTRSKSLTQYMMSLPPRFRDMSFSLKTLPNGNQVVDGRILGWVYKLRKMVSESPITAFHRDLSLFEMQRGREIKISKTAAAINHWIIHDRKDLPMEITRMSFKSYNTPVTEDGTLPVELFGRKLNFKRLKEMGIPWLICIADKDDLVDKEASLVALDFVDAEVCVFPKGHAAIATSWSIPDSEYALHLRFCSSHSDLSSTCKGKHYRGPVRFHLDLEESSSAAASGLRLFRDCISGHASLPPGFVQFPSDCDQPAQGSVLKAAMRWTCTKVQPECCVAYAPSSLSDTLPRETPAKGFHSATVTETGEKDRSIDITASSVELNQIDPMSRAQEKRMTRLLKS